MHSIIEMGTLRTIKYLLEKRNIQVGICREPLSTLSIEEKHIIDKFFSHYKVAFSSYFAVLLSKIFY